MDLREFWDAVPPERRHILSAIEPERCANQLHRWLRHAETQLPWANIHAVVDWGCGGGLIAHAIAKRHEDARLLLCDVSADSLHAGLCTVLQRGGAVEPGYWLPSDPSHLSWNGRLWPVDLLVCYAVIHHMPGLAYFQQVAAYWRDVVQPRWLALQFREGPLAERMGDAYTAGDGYVFGLTIERESVEAQFPGYRTTHYGADGCWGHLVLERR